MERGGGECECSLFSLFSFFFPWGFFFWRRLETRRKKRRTRSLLSSFQHYFHRFYDAYTNPILLLTARIDGQRAAPVAAPPTARFVSLSRACSALSPPTTAFRSFALAIALAEPRASARRAGSAHLIVLATAARPRSYLNLHLLVTKSYCEREERGGEQGRGRGFTAYERARRAHAPKWD